MTAESLSTKSTATKQDFAIARIIDAPRTLVFKAWTEAARVKEWWGPECFTCPVCEIDLRVGGAYRFVMRSPEGVDYAMTGVYRKIDEPKELVFTDVCDEHPADWHEVVNRNRPNAKGNLKGMVTTVTFEEESNKTNLTVKMHFDSIEDHDALVKIGMADGWSQTLDKLQDYIANA